MWGWSTTKTWTTSFGPSLYKGSAGGLVAGVGGAFSGVDGGVVVGRAGVACACAICTGTGCTGGETAGVFTVASGGSATRRSGCNPAVAEIDATVNTTIAIKGTAPA